jgi:hypothetical protein
MGDGIYNAGELGYKGGLSLTNNVIMGNTSYSLGGGIYNSGTWSSNSLITGNTAERARWYIYPSGELTTQEESYDIDARRFIKNKLHPTYPDIYDVGNLTTLFPSPNPSPKPTILVGSGSFDANKQKVVFEVTLSSAYDKPVSVDYYTLDGSTNSIDPEKSKDFESIVKNPLYSSRVNYCAKKLRLTSSEVKVYLLTTKALSCLQKIRHFVVGAKRKKEKR